MAKWKFGFYGAYKPYLAGLAVGIFQDIEHIKSLEQGGQEFKPKNDRTWAIDLIKKYRETLKKL